MVTVHEVVDYITSRVLIQQYIVNVPKNIFQLGSTIGRRPIQNFQ